jgi:osmoprotectant transport system permease protein
MELLVDVVDWFTAPGRWSGNRGIPFRTLEHLQLSVVGTAIAIGLAVPPALWLAHRRRGEFLANAVVNIGRAIPSFGIIVVAAFVALRWGQSLRFWPVVVALVLLALPPIFTNTYAGVTGVDRATVEAARGMGLTEGDILRRIELPIATPVMLAGIRIAFVQVIATATLGAIVSPGGGLGRYIIDGFARGPAGYAEVFAGALLVAGLTVAAEGAFSLGERLLLPGGVRRLVSTEEVAATASAGGG